MDDDVEDLPPKKATAASKGKNKSASETYVKVRFSFRFLDLRNELTVLLSSISSSLNSNMF